MPYHWAQPSLAEEAILEAGHYGRAVRAAGQRHRNALRESVLEDIRLNHFPVMPSRLSFVGKKEEATYDDSRFISESSHCAHEDRLCTRSFEDLFELAMAFLSNPWNWSSERLEDKRTALKLTFADRLPYHRKNGSRTPKTIAFNALGGLTMQKCEMAPRLGFELRADACLYLSPRHPPATPCQVVADLCRLEPKCDTGDTMAKA